MISYTELCFEFLRDKSGPSHLAGPSLASTPSCGKCKQKLESDQFENDPPPLSKGIPSETSVRPRPARMPKRHSAAAPHSAAAGLDLASQQAGL